MENELDVLFSVIEISNAIEGLPYTEQVVVRARIEGYSLKEIAEFFGVTRQAIKGREAKAWTLLQKKSIIPREVRYPGKPEKTPALMSNPEVLTYYGMIRRCNYPTQANYCYYGYLGIEVCFEWVTNPEIFFNDMGPRPEGHTLDRVNPEEDYSKENCRWASHSVQAGNRRTGLNVPRETKEWFRRGAKESANKATKKWTLAHPGYHKEYKCKQLKENNHD